MDKVVFHSESSLNSEFQANDIVPVGVRFGGRTMRRNSLEGEMPEVIVGGLGVNRNAVDDLATSVDRPLPGGFFLAIVLVIVFLRAHGDRELILEGAADRVVPTRLAVFTLEGETIQNAESRDVQAEKDGHALSLVVIETGVILDAQQSDLGV